MADDPKTTNKATGDGAGGSGAGSPPATPPPAAAPVPTEFSDRLLLAETENAALKARLTETESVVTRLSETLVAKEKTEKANAVRSELQGLVRQGRLSPAEFATYCEQEERLLLMAEHTHLVDAIKARPVIVEFREKGHGMEVDADPKMVLLAEADRLKAEAAKAGTKLTTPQALALARSGQGGN